MRILAFLLLLASVSTAPCAPPELEILIVYDNTSARKDLTPGWGFAAVVSHRGRQVLFDTGAKGDLLIENGRKLGIDWKSVSQVIISHAHGDHTGGIAHLKRVNPGLVFHLMDRFHPGAHGAAPAPFELAPGIWSTGVIDGAPPEQSLLIETKRGLVILTGCSHPGIVRIVETALRQRGKDSVRLLVGGFHMLKQNSEEIAAAVSRLKQLGVEAVVPTHCTGEAAIAKFREVYGAKFDSGGAGKRIVLE